MQPRRRLVLVEGLTAGLAGYLAIVLFFGVASLLAGRSFFAAAIDLGSGLAGTGARGGTAGAVFAVNGLHLLAFLAIGTAAAWLVLQAERHPSFAIVVLYAGLAGFFLSLAGFTALEASGARVPGWGLVAAANILAGVAMGGLLVRAHPRAWTALRSGADPETEHPSPER
ncbi:MAG: hypothetical protein RRA92_04225 [Gemmatimonadota bacterium]|nr:hypothetical protein [Gemmatimonadota bacterium]